jgi:uncharacterized protein (DUF1697 family)
VSFTHIAFLRAIGPKTHKKMSMAALRDGCLAAGLKDAKTFIQTGNILFRSTASDKTVVAKIAAVLSSIGLDNDVFLRTPHALKKLLAANLLKDAARERPNHLLVVMLAGEPDSVLARQIETHGGPETVRCKGREIYVDYAEGIARSKVTPGVIERRLKMKGTARNWNTLQKLLALSLPGN